MSAITSQLYLTAMGWLRWRFLIFLFVHSLSFGLVIFSYIQFSFLRITWDWERYLDPEGVAQRKQENDEIFTLKILKIYENGILFFCHWTHWILVNKNVFILKMIEINKWTNEHWESSHFIQEITLHISFFWSIWSHFQFKSKRLKEKGNPMDIAYILTTYIYIINSHKHI